MSTKRSDSHWWQIKWSSIFGLNTERLEEYRYNRDLLHDKIRRLKSEIREQKIFDWKGNLVGILKAENAEVLEEEIDDAKNQILVINNEIDKILGL